ncbi:MAG: DUF480 domain-containing protein [Bryobacteraceae bacterium]
MLGNVPYDLGPVEHRVLGALIEKDLATPEYYPLSLNALTNACNQKTNRDPVMACDEASVRSALESLREGGLAVFVSEAGSRVLKFRHRLSDALNLSSGELAAIAVLLLRGPQTTGELRGRTSNLHSFADIEAVQHVLNKLASREPEPLAAQMSRLPGTKEPRWCHLFAPVPETQGAVPVSIAAAAGPGLRDRVEQLESEAKALREQLETMRKDLDELRSALL